VQLPMLVILIGSGANGALAWCEFTRGRHRLDHALEVEGTRFLSSRELAGVWNRSAASACLG
jgi:hypothetical protein